MNTWTKLLILLLIAFAAANENESAESGGTDDDDKIKTLPKKMLARRREEHFKLLQGIALNPKYEWRFKLVEIGVEKVFDLINENKAKLKDDEGEKVSEERMIVIENSCLLLDFIVNFKQDIYKIFDRISKKKSDKIDWKKMVQLAFEILEKEKDLLDELTTKEYEFVRGLWDKIYNEEELPEYPYENNIKRDINIAERLYQGEQEKLKALNKKEKKKLKKGPALRSIEL